MKVEGFKGIIGMHSVHKYRVKHPSFSVSDNGFKKIFFKNILPM